MRRKSSNTSRHYSMEELDTHLRRQLRFLITSCYAYDQGDFAECVRIAIALRIIFYQSFTSKALLPRTSLAAIKLFSSVLRARAINETGPYTPLCALQYGTTMTYIPKIDSERLTILSVDAWWEQAIIISSHNSHCLSRKQLVKSVANKDGGAHVDDAPDQASFAIREENALGWMHFSGGNGGVPMQDLNIESASLRQIAHEVLRSVYSDYSVDTNTAAWREPGANIVTNMSMGAP